MTNFKLLFKAIAAVVICLNLTTCGNYDGTCIEGNCTNGQGTLAHPNGDKYVGEFKVGKANGQGTLMYPDGIKYVGEIKDNKINGQGTLTYCDSAKYVGGFKDNKFSGQGTLTYADGRIKRGIWKDNKIEKLVEQGSNKTSVKANGVAITNHAISFIDTSH